MKATLIFAVILVVFFMHDQANCQDPGERIWVAEDFEEFRVVKTPDTDQETLWLKVNKDLPPYKVQLIPDLAVMDGAGANNPPHRVGQIEIWSGNPVDPVQTIEVVTRAGIANFRGYFTAVDINMDGYLDIAVVDDFGAKWVRQKYWLYDKDSGRFITNSLTKDLHRLTNNGIVLNPESKEIKVKFLTVPPGIVSETYKLENGHLVFVQMEEIRETKEGGTRIFIKKKVNGKMTTVGTKDDDPD